LPEFADDTIIDYSRPTPSIESNTTDSLEVIKTNKVETARNSSVKYAEMYRNTSKSPKVKGYLDSGCSRHMTSNISYLSEYEPYDGGYVSFGQEGGNITGKEIENLKDLKVKIIRSDNEGEFKNKEMTEFCTKKGIKREFINARTPQQKRVAERRNRTLIKAARTMLADAKLPVTFWAEVVNTACYVQNKVLVNKFAERRNRTLIEVARTMLADANLPVTFWAEAVNTACYVQNRVLVNKSQNKTPYELFNSRTPAIGFLRPFGCHVMILNTLDHLGKFDAKGNEVVVAGTSSTNISAHMESSNSYAQDACNANVSKSSGISNSSATSKIPIVDKMKSLTVESVIPTVSSPVPTACLDISPKTSNTIRMEADLSNMESSIPASPTPTFRIHKDHPKSQIIGPVDTPVQTRHKSKEMEEHSFITTIHQKTTLDLLQFCLFSCFLSQEEPKKIFDDFKDPIWVEAMQEELLQFKIQNVWILVDCLKGIRPIGTKWVLKNKKDERGIVIRNKARLVAQRHTQEECINYEEVFSPVTRIEAIRLFLAYASFMGFTVYQMDVKSTFLYGTINEEVHVMQPPGFQDLKISDRVYKVEKAMYGLHQAPRAWYEFEALMHDKFQMSAMGELTFFLGLQVLQKKDGIFLLQDKYGKDGPGKDVELHLYGSMIGSLMYLTTSRPDIMFAVCACARHQVTPKECHLYAVKRIFRYLKGHPKLGLRYPKESPFDLVAYSDSDYGGATQDRKSTTGGC
nr:retrovirus-related Pol polyprotein from transposon TNT 1-94 [Tanacetum cinerariifolium]